MVPCKGYSGVIFTRPVRRVRVGTEQLRAETREWEQTAALIGRFFTVKAEDLK